MTKTTVRDYDAEGNLVRETITEQDEMPTYTASRCLCYAIGIYGYCPAHGYRPSVTWTSPTIGTYTGTVTTSHTNAVGTATVRASCS